MFSSISKICASTSLKSVASSQLNLPPFKTESSECRLPCRSGSLHLCLNTAPSIKTWQSKGLLCVASSANIIMLGLLFDVKFSIGLSFDQNLKLVIQSMFRKQLGFRFYKWLYLVIDALPTQVIDLDKQWRARQFKLEQIKKDINKLNKKIMKLKIVKQDATEVIMKLEDHKKEIAAKEVEVKEAKKEFDERLSLVRNLVHDTVPVDNDQVKMYELGGQDV